MNNCHICHSHDLAEMEFSPKNNAFSDTCVSEKQSDLKVTLKLYH